MLALLLTAGAMVCAPSAYAAKAKDPGRTLYGGDPAGISDSDLADFIAGYEGNGKNSRMRSADLYVDHLDVEITIENDRTVSVVERYDVMFNEEMHGYQRYIPTYGYEEMYRITNVYAEGAEAYIREDSDEVYIRLGSEYETVRGMVSYEIGYDVEYFSDITEGGDRIYQNVFPGELENYVRNATARIRMPEGVELRDSRVYSGAYGDKNSYKVESFYADGVMYLYAEDYFKPNEGASVELLFDEGIFVARPADVVVDELNVDLQVFDHGGYILKQDMTVTASESATQPVLPVWQMIWMEGDGHSSSDLNRGVHKTRTSVTIDGRLRDVDWDVTDNVRVDLSRTNGKTITVSTTQTGNFEVPEGKFSLSAAFRPVSYGNFGAIEYKKINITAHLPSQRGTEFTCERSVLTGADGQGDYYFTVTDTPDGFAAEMTSQMPVGESIVVRFALPEGAVARKTSWVDWTAGIGGLAFALLGIILRAFKKEKSLVPTMEFYPPDDLNPAEVGYIIDGRADSGDLTALIYYWASHGHLTIEVTGKTGCILHRGADLDGLHKDYEFTMYRRLWSLGDGNAVSTAQLTDKYYTTLTKATVSLKRSFDSTDRRLTKKSSDRLSLILSLLMIAAVLILPFAIIFFAPASTGKELFAGAAGALCFIPMLGLCSSAVDLRNKRKRSARVFSGIAIAVLAVIGTVLMTLMLSPVALARIPAFLLSAGIAVVLILSQLLRSRTDYGTYILGRCVGFKQFLETAEKQRLEMLLNENPDYYYDILPYAQVLGVSDAWTDRFKGLDTAPPDWFYGEDVTRTAANYLMLRNMTSMGTAMRSVPVETGGGKGGFGGFSGGGGGFGGGFSGGGGGGGGGGGW